MGALLLATVIGALPETPADVYEAVAIDLATVPAVDRPWMRYLALWPSPESSQESLESAAGFWLNSISWSPTIRNLRIVGDGGLWRLDLREWGWNREAWETIAKADPYFAVTASDSGKGVIRRGWLDPRVELTVRKETGSTKAVLRADWFVARTSLDGEKGFFQGFYSTFLGLPKTEKELNDILGAKEEQKLGKSSEFNKLFLLQGGAVLQSSVAQHNRGLELLPTVVGKSGARFLWRSLDTDSDAGDASVLEKLAGTHRVAGKEFIYSLPNGLHGYYATNGNGEQVREVPTNVAQDKGHPHDAIVYVGFKCVRCHGPNGGINGFDDVIRRLRVARKTGVAVIGDRYGDDDFKRRLEAYYGGDLGEDTAQHRTVYGRAVKDAAARDHKENTTNYLGLVEGYLWGRVDLQVASNESGLGDETETYIKLTSPSPLVALLAGESISRELWEANFGRLMTAKIWEWEEKP